MKKRVGIKDVAKAAGVSITTVSRALNGYQDISTETKEKIQDIVKELQYVPNASARSLGGIKKKTIGLLVSDLQVEDESGFLNGIFRGAYASTIDNDCDFVIIATNKIDQKRVPFMQICNQKQVSAVLVQGMSLDDPYYNQIAESTIPCILIDISATGDNVYSVSTDNIGASKEITHKIIDMGHTEIGVLIGKENAEVSIARQAGYIEAFNEANLKVKKEYFRGGSFSEKEAYNQTKDLIEQNPELTAIFCFSDIMAFGAINAINDMNLRVPEDISVVGFDDVAVSKYINGGLTTVHQNPFLIGKTAADLAYMVINEMEINKNNFIPYTIQLRNTLKKRK